MAKFVALALLTGVDSRLIKSDVKIPGNQIVKIGDFEVYSQSAGHDLLNTCTSFAPTIVNDPNQPVVTVCGAQTRVTVFLRNMCEPYHHYQEAIGSCNTAAGDGCVTVGPTQQHWMSTAQSYIIEQCATGTVLAEK